MKDLDDSASPESCQGKTNVTSSWKRYQRDDRVSWWVWLILLLLVVFLYYYHK